MPKEEGKGNFSFGQTNNAKDNKVLVGPKSQYAKIKKWQIM